MDPPRIDDLVPELSVSDTRASLAFYVGVLGFEIVYERPEEGFAFLRLGRAQLMIDRISLGRTFAVDGAPLEHPLGRGMNLQIMVAANAPLLASLESARIALYLPPEERWYRAGGLLLEQRQFAVADPDGYLLRFAERIGSRPAPRAGQPSPDISR